MPSRSWAVLAAALTVLAVVGCGGGRPHRSTPSSASGRPSVRAGGVAAGWLTYHADNARTGAAPSGPAPQKARRLWSVAVDGAVYAEPLVAGQTVIVATENDSLYAFDARSGARRWRAHLDDPVPASSLPCGNIDPSGITSTPVVDGSAGVVYAVTFAAPPHHTLVAIDLTDGRLRWRRPIDPPRSDPTLEQQRGALALSRGRVYVPYGGLFGDCGDYHGYLVGAQTGGPTHPLVSFRTPAALRSGIWSPSGPAVDGSGNLFVATGNGASTSFDFGNAVIRLSPSLARSGFFAPSNAADLSGPDLDLGSTGPVLLPGARLVVAGKDGVAYLASSTSPGGLGGALASRRACSGQAFGGIAYASGAVYVPCTSGVAALKPADLSPLWTGPAFDAGSPVVASGYVWDVALDAGKLYALDARSGRPAFTATIGTPAHFIAPTVAGGRVYVAAGGRLLAFGSG